MNPTNNVLKLAVIGAVAFTATATRAATFTNTATNPATSTWNTTAFWSSTPSPVSSGNDYQMNPDPTRVTNNTPITTSFTVQLGAASTAWAMYGFARDYDGNTPSGPSTFLGDKLILTDKTAFRGFGRNTTSTGNWEMQSGSYMVLNANGSGTATAWNGTISTSGNTALGLVTNNATGLTVNASISGTGTLSLVMSGGSIANLNLNGDISLFTGTLLLSGSTQANANTRTFSIANSAPEATLQLNWVSNAFRYDLSTNDVSFSSLILGTDTVLDAGTYDAAYLNSLTGNAGIFSGTGTITVVPEPSVYALGMLGLVAVLAAGRRRRRRSMGTM